MIRECLKSLGKIPEESDLLTISVMVDIIVVEICLSKIVGIGSSSHCLLGDSWRSLEISRVVAGRKRGKGVGLCGGLK